MLDLPAAEGEKALAEVVEQNEQAGARQHGQVALELWTPPGSGQQPDRERLGQTVGQGPAYGDVHREAEHHAGSALLIAEGEALVEKEADHTAHQIVGRGGDPIAQVPPGVEPGQIVQAEHDPIAHGGVDHPHQQKAEEGGVQKLFEFIPHPGGLRTRRPRCTGAGP